MDVSNFQILVAEIGLFGTAMIFGLYLLSNSPFAFRVEGRYEFIIGRKPEQVVKLEGGPDGD